MDEEEIKKLFYSLKTREDVANLLEITDKSLRYFLYKVRPENMYHSFTIPKKDGSLRIISAPCRELLAIQRKLSQVLSMVYEPKPCAFGFVNGKNHIDNARHHINRRSVFNIDLKDFFTQIHFGRVRGMLINKPYCIGTEAATTISQIACLNAHLPQGAPSSPIITNMILSSLDNALMHLAKKTNCFYTRYADDITFSTYKHSLDKSIVVNEGGNITIGDSLAKILKNNSFEVNEAKISLRSHNARQEVTGLTVNRFPNTRRSYTKQLRAIIHNCEKYGIYDAAKFYIQKGFCKNHTISSQIDNPDAEDIVTNWFKRVLIGKTHYIKQVKGSQNLPFLSFAKRINELFDETIFDISFLDFFGNSIKNSVFVLEDPCSGNQGSGFYIPNIGIITSYHVTENGGFYQVYPYEANKGKTYGMIGKDINELSSDKDIDYAIYKPVFSLNDNLTFKCGNSRNLKIGDSVTIIGYPNYQAGNSPYIQSCTITSTKKYFNGPLYTVSGRIVHGASGGIVLNSQYEAVGIIKGGIESFDEDDHTESDGFVPLYLALDHMKQAHNDSM